MLYKVHDKKVKTRKHKAREVFFQGKSPNNKQGSFRMKVNERKKRKDDTKMVRLESKHLNSTPNYRTNPILLVDLRC